MSSNSDTIQVGMTNAFPCSYLANQQEQLLVLQEETLDVDLFERLLALGFRRSGQMIYKPHCPACQACLPIRVPVKQFQPSRRQKRNLKNNRDISFAIVAQSTPEQYQLYEQYINERHYDGPMYPASKEQYEQFIQCSWHQPLLIELRVQGRLIGVAVTDQLPNSLSAIYSFFAPSEDKRSLGSLMILLQCRLAKLMGKNYLYLGYQIDDSRKMNYKKSYQPNEILTSKGWQLSVL
ncbi:putative arginyl-tRNA--protein transferase [Shewanella colwelliana]|uniref:Aspartate/glutamate leucyltransferase n=1 Tax=Shewanella colwelliana TaxID=23 RepID=A0A1E5IYA7_SHECO|nr:arginyltransferase [Shewanella colwelliana]MDX1282770.1 arginyltransferase [Shewanella colwelliana]OEG75530.1 arginyltransferase [Shewanella colwelliana]GIU29269.1 putative arginyl-tRNA--protein transferase [Shewanella colwelliana]GIU42761.1 putative arginyl-tRNA--protein transferase [Shewanella colwelliana]